MAKRAAARLMYKLENQRTLTIVDVAAVELEVFDGSGPRSIEALANWLEIRDKRSTVS